MKPTNIVETSTSILSINDDGVGLMHFKEGANIDIPEQMEHFNGIIELTANHPTPFVVTAGEYVNFTKEAKENAPLLEAHSPVNAFAIVIHNLAYRLIASFYFKMQKPKIPYKTFSDTEEAAEWCKQFVVKEGSNTSVMNKNTSPSFNI